MEPVALILEYSAASGTLVTCVGFVCKKLWNTYPARLLTAGRDIQKAVKILQKRGDYRTLFHFGYTDEAITVLQKQGNYEALFSYGYTEQAIEILHRQYNHFALWRKGYIAAMFTMLEANADTPRIVTYLENLPIPVSKSIFPWSDYQSLRRDLKQLSVKLAELKHIAHTHKEYADPLLMHHLRSAVTDYFKDLWDICQRLARAAQFSASRKAIAPEIDSIRLHLSNTIAVTQQAIDSFAKRALSESLEDWRREDAERSITTFLDSATSLRQHRDEAVEELKQSLRQDA